MPLFFDGERKPKVEPAALPAPDLAAALSAVSMRRDPHVVTALGHLASVEDARALERECRRLDAALTVEIQANRVRTQAEAVVFVANASKGVIPADAFITLLKDRVGKTKTATWAETVTAAKDEDVATTAMSAESIVEKG